jgi:hypothetical protein
MSTKATYVAKAEAEFKEAQVQLSALAKSAKKAVTAGQAEGERLLQAAQSKHDEALHRFELLKRAGEESWDSVKATFETAWTDLSHALHQKV